MEANYNNKNLTMNGGYFMQGATIGTLNTGGEQTVNNYHHKAEEKKEEPAETIAKWLLRKVGL